MKYLSNNNNGLDNKMLDDILIRAEKLFQEGGILFEAGISDTREFGKVSSLADIFLKAVVIACAASNLNVDAKALRNNITPSANGIAFAGIETGAYKRANYKRSPYSSEFAQTFKTAMEPNVRAKMLEPLRGVIMPSSVAVKTERELTLANA